MATTTQEADRIGQVMYEIKQCEELQKRLDRKAAEILVVFREIEQEFLARDLRTRFQEPALRARVSNYPTADDLVALALERIAVRDKLSDLRDDKTKLGY